MRSDGAENSLDLPGITAMFSASGLTIVDLATLDGDISHDFCAWFNYTEAPPSPGATVAADQIERRLASLAAELRPTQRTIDHGMISEGYGQHGRLTVRQPGCPDSDEAEVTLDLGPWGWTRWELGLWEESHSYTGQEETSNLGIAVTADSPQRLHMGTTPPEREYHFIGIPPLDRRGYGWYGWPEIVVAATATYTFVPFINAFTARAGEDCYQALRTMIGRKNQPHEHISIIDHDSDSELVFREPLPDEAIRQLALMDPKLLRRRTAEWNQETAKWEISRELRPKKPKKSFRRNLLS
jgi:hypothetical protein